MRSTDSGVTSLVKTATVLSPTVGPPSAVSSRPGGFRREHRAEAHLVRRRPDEVEAFRVRLQEVLGAA